MSSIGRTSVFLGLAFLGWGLLNNVADDEAVLGSVAAQVEVSERAKEIGTAFSASVSARARARSNEKQTDTTKMMMIVFVTGEIANGGVPGTGWVNLFWDVFGMHYTPPTESELDEPGERLKLTFPFSYEYLQSAGLDEIIRSKVEQTTPPKYVQHKNKCVQVIAIEDMADTAGAPMEDIEFLPMEREGAGSSKENAIIEQTPPTLTEKGYGVWASCMGQKYPKGDPEGKNRWGHFGEQTPEGKQWFSNEYKDDEGAMLRAVDQAARASGMDQALVSQMKHALVNGGS